MTTMPVLFVGHGSPMNALAKTPFTERLNQLGRSLPKPQAILCVSAHWETQGTHVLYHATPPTIHDFYGFPQALFDLQYPARGPLSVAHEAQRLLPKAELSETWGLDHGTWSVLVHMYPHADIPTFQVSIDVTKSARAHIEMGQKLQALREQGVLIVGSGNIVHNLKLIKWREPNANYPWAVNFDERIKKALIERNEQELFSYTNDADEEAQLSSPSPEHFQPLLYCFGASRPTDKVSFPYEGFEMGSLSMRTVMWEAK